MSASHRIPSTNRTFLRNRSPARWMAALAATSGFVSRLRFPCIDRRVAADVAQEPVSLPSPGPLRLPERGLTPIVFTRPKYCSRQHPGHWIHQVSWRPPFNASFRGGWLELNQRGAGVLSRTDDRSESGYFPGSEGIAQMCDLHLNRMQLRPEWRGRLTVRNINPKKRMVSPFFVTAVQKGSCIVCLVTGRPRG
jgi:hypothetical protein